MAITMPFVVCLLFLFSSNASANDDVIEELRKHITRLDAKLEQQTFEIKALTEDDNLDKRELVRKVEELDRRVSSLEEENTALRKENQRCRTRLLNNVFAKKKIGHKHKSALSNIEKKNDVRQNGPRVEKRTDAGLEKPRRAIDGSNIAFTVYLDHDVDHLGSGQTLKYNQVLLNDGRGYNIHSGVFTAPVTGVYSFTFFIGQRDYRDAGAALYVNNKNTVDAIVETDVPTEDAQGGNSAVLKVNAGDIVYVKVTFGSHLEGNVGTGRYTTFSGFLLYPTEGDSVTVGK